ncbi:MAG: hypothetical protein GVY19_06755 [Bacteroidetes bacterium]|jgi:RHS repeat-associated protein|nr:hypothetical protein [Bacteroidota bacterium]
MKVDGDMYRYGYQGQFAEDETEETGYNSFEARMFDAKIGRWTTMDPYAQYYSPYLSMGNNPISSIDPDGGLDDGYQVSSNGEINKISNEGGVTKDFLYNSNMTKKIEINDLSIMPSLEKQGVSQEGYGMHSAVSTNKIEMFKTFDFVSTSSNVEWSMIGLNNGKYSLSTFNVDYVAPGIYSHGYAEKAIKFDIHSHARINGKFGASPGDKSYYKMKGIKIPHFVFEKENRGLYQYNGYGSSSEGKMNSYGDFLNKF